MTIDIEQLRTLHANATPGPYRADDSEIYGGQFGYDWVGETLDTDDQDRTRANSAYIVAACNALPQVLAELAYLRAENTKLRHDARATLTAQPDLPNPVDQHRDSGWRRYEFGDVSVAVQPDPERPYRFIVEMDGDETYTGQTSEQVEDTLAQGARHRDRLNA